jgi:hypothetical protein
MSRPLRRLFFWWAATAASVALLSCGGGGGEPPIAASESPSTTSSPSTNGTSVTGPAVAGANVLSMRVDRGTNGSTINVPYVTVTICQPGGAACQDIDHVIVDTGSSGLRLAASALPAGMQLPSVTDAGGTAVGECAHFASGFSWGSVRRADVRLAGATASNISVQVVGDPAAAFATVPSDCSATGQNIGAGQGARGILGVGLFDEDCGRACEVSTAPAVYFGCGGSGCTSTRLAQASQVRNPVAALPSDNNGVVLVLPAVPAGGAASVTGSLILGIGTQGNNQLGGATVFTTDAQGFFTTTYKGVSYPSSFIDSGSNGLFFTDASIPRCGDFYCPAGPLPLSATNTSASGVTGTVTFTLDPANQLVTDAAAAVIGGDPGAATRSFDWGLPFFFGRTVFVARSGASTPAGPGPYWAY